MPFRETQGAVTRFSTSSPKNGTRRSPFDGMRQSHFANMLREVGALGRPVAEGAPKAVWHVAQAGITHHLDHCHVREWTADAVARKHPLIVVAALKLQNGQH